jgi:hypothetical protein
MEQVLLLAEKGWGTTHPNPMVGALIEEDGQVVAEGFHQQAGGPHAEVVALQNLGRKPKGWGGALCQPRAMLLHRSHPALHLGDLGCRDQKSGRLCDRSRFPPRRPRA